MRSSVIGVAVILLVILVACGERGASGPEPQTPTPQTNAPQAAAPQSNAPQAAVPREPVPTPTGGTGNVERLVLGREAYQEAMCSMCHGAEGRGNSMGPDLTSKERVHSDGSVEGILAVLEAGVPKGEIVNPRFGMAMPSAKEIVADPDRLRALAEYVASLSR